MSAKKANLPSNQLLLPLSETSETIMDTCKFTLVVNDFLTLKPHHHFVESSEFPLEQNKNLRFYIRAYPNGDQKAFKNYISVHVGAKSYHLVKISKLNIKLSLYNVMDEKIFEKQYKCPYEPKLDKQNTLSIKFSDFFPRKFFIAENRLEGFFLTRDKFTISCSIVVYFSNADEEPPKNQTNETDTNMVYYQQLFNKSINTDFKFIVDGKEIKAHKSILSSKCVVFKDLMNTSWKKTNTILISGISHNAFRELIRFLYTGEVENLACYVNQLISAAHKYKLTELENVCAMEFLKKIDTNNVWGILGIADSFGIKYLKQAAYTFIAANEECMSTPGFKETFKNRPHLFNEILNGFSK